MTSREIVRRVLARDHPPRIGLTFSPLDGEPRLYDLAHTGPAPDPHAAVFGWRDDGAGGEIRQDEWGCIWRRIMGKSDKGEVIDPPLKDWSDLASYRMPTLADPNRYRSVSTCREAHADRYLLGSLHGCAFNVARYLRRFEQYLLDCAATPDRVRELNRRLNDLAVAQVEIYAGLGVDGVMIGEDWGTEDRLLVSPAMWDELFRPGFERLIGRAHELGLTFWMHSCGYVKDIIATLVDLGVDVFQFDQPELCGLDFLAQFDVTYWSPIDIQWTLPTGNRDRIEATAREMIAKLGGQGGGLIAKDYPDNRSIGTDPSWQDWAYRVFLEEGVYQAATA